MQHRIDGAIVDAELEVAMLGRRVSGAADQRDRFAALDLVAGLDEQFLAWA
jgi:hypothetical protein